MRCTPRPVKHFADEDAWSLNPWRPYVASMKVNQWMSPLVPVHVLFGISVFAVLDMPLDDLLRRRFTSFRTIYLPTVGRLAECRFQLLPTGQRPHFTVQIQSVLDSELERLLSALGAAQPNPQYARGMIWREED